MKIGIIYLKICATELKLSSIVNILTITTTPQKCYTRYLHFQYVITLTRFEKKINSIGKTTFSFNFVDLYTYSSGYLNLCGPNHTLPLVLLSIWLALLSAFSAMLESGVGQSCTFFITKKGDLDLGIINLLLSSMFELYQSSTELHLS